MQKNVILVAFVTMAVVLIAVMTGCGKDEDTAIPYDISRTTVVNMAHTGFIYSNRFGIEAGEYNPMAVKNWGDTLLVVNGSVAGTGSGMNNVNPRSGLFLMSASSGDTICSRYGWKRADGEFVTFDQKIIDAAVNDRYIFVVNRSSRIDIFLRKDLSYVATIGKTGWQDSRLTQCESAEVCGAYLYIRDKESVKVVRLEELSKNEYRGTENKIPVFASSRRNVTSNQKFSLETVAVWNGKAYITDYQSSGILESDPKNVTADSIPFSRIYKISKKPLGMGFHKGMMYVVCENNTIIQVDPETGEEMRSWPDLGGENWAKPGRIWFMGDTLYITQREFGTPKLLCGKMETATIETILAD